MARIRKAKQMGLCPLCEKWLAVNDDGTLQTHGPTSRRQQRHIAITPTKTLDREQYLDTCGLSRGKQAVPPQA